MATRQKSDEGPEAPAVEHSDGDPVWVQASSGRCFEVPYGDDTFTRLMREGGVIVTDPEAGE